MATIKLKRGTTTPTTSDITSGEVAVDTSAQKLYINDNGTVKVVGTSFSATDTAASATILAASRNFSGSGVITLSTEGFNGSGDVALTSSVGTFNLANLTNVATTTPTNTQVLAYNTSAGTWGPVDAATGGGAETNDLSSVVTWANVPDVNITESSVTQHQAALAVAQSQVTNLSSTFASYMPLTGGAFSGAVTTNSTFDGRDVATDGTKLDTIEASADITDTANVVAALTAGTNVTIAGNGTISSTDTNTTYTVGDGGLTQKNFTTALDTKLAAIETNADVTDTANVVAALTAGTNVTIAGDGTISSSGGGGGSAVTDTTWYELTVSATTANQNTTGTVIWDGAYHEDSNFSLSNGVVTVGTAGTYKVHANLVMTSAVQRAAVRVQVAFNGTTPNTARGSTGYIRNASGHTDTSVAVTEIQVLAAGDTIRIRTAAEAAAGTVNVISNASRLIIERLEIGTGAAAGNSSTTGKTLVATDMNTTINASGTITVPNSIAAAGDIVIVHNTTSGNISIADGTITTMRLAGTGTTGTRTLAQRGVGFLYFATATEVVVGGSGVS